MKRATRQRILSRWAALVCERPLVVIVVVLAFVAGAVALTLTSLGFRSSRSALFSSDRQWNANYEAWRANFPGSDDMFVVVDAGQPKGAAALRAYESANQTDRQKRARELVRELGMRLGKNEHIEKVIWGYSLDQFSARAMRVKDIDDFNEDLTDVEIATYLIASPAPRDLLAKAIAAFRGNATDTDPEQSKHLIETFIDVLGATRRVLTESPGDRPSFLDLVNPPDEDPYRYLTSTNDRMFYMRVAGRKQPNAPNVYAATIEACRAEMNRMRPEFPDIEFGLSGIDVIEYDEGFVAAREAKRAAIIALVLVAVLLITAFHSWKAPLIAVGTLLCGLALSFGFATLVVGHLQTISVIVGVILVGLGIDYAIHFLTGLETIRHDHDDTARGFSDAMRDVFCAVGPGLVTCAVTTAIAFGAMVFTGFRGLAEMGLIAAGGVLLCLVATISVLPTLLRLFKSRHRHIRRIGERRVDVFRAHWVKPFADRPGLTLGVALFMTVASLIAARQIVGFDYDILKVFPHDTESIHWQQRAYDDGRTELWTCMSIAPDLDKAYKRTLALRDKCRDVVGIIDGVGMLFPADDNDKIEAIEEKRNSAPADVIQMINSGSLSKPSAEAFPGVGLTQHLAMIRLGMQLQGSGALATEEAETMKSLGKAIDDLLVTLNGLTPALRVDRLATLQKEYTALREFAADRLRAVFDTSRLRLDDFPPDLLRPFVGSDGPFKGQFALEIYPKLPDDGSIYNALDTRFLPRFVSSIERNVDPNVTGVAPQVFRTGALIKVAYVWAGVLALAAVFVLVLIDLRSLTLSLLCLVPVATGFTLTLGLMAALGMHVNPANIVVLPLMFGIGVDSGVQMIHRYQHDPVSRPCGLTAGTGKAITLTSLTTMIGFGALLFSEHPGMASLAFVLTVGIGLTLLSCWTVVPASLEFRQRGLANDSR